MIKKTVICSFIRLIRWEGSKQVHYYIANLSWLTLRAQIYITYTPAYVFLIGFKVFVTHLHYKHFTRFNILLLKSSRKLLL